MALIELQAGLPPSLTLSAKFYGGGALVLTQALIESPAASGVYCYPSTMSLAAGVYAWVIVDGSANQYATNGAQWAWSGAAQIVNLLA